MILEGGISKNYTQNWDKNGNIYYTDENGQVVDFKVNPFVKLANKAKATAMNIGNWINETDPNSEAYKQKVSAIVGLETLPLGLGRFATQQIARGLTPYVDRKIAQNMATGASSGVAGGTVTGGLEAGLNDRNIGLGALKGGFWGLLGGLGGGYGLGKVAQKLNTQTAWHGSPYKFDRFSNEAIGTGEGAQAHGYGHYVAKDKGVADEYRRRLTKEVNEGAYPISYEGKLIDYDTTEGKIIDNIVNNKYQYALDDYSQAKDEYLYQLQHSIENPVKNLEFLSEQAKERLPIAQNINPANISEYKGQLYKLSIPKDDVMLREGLPFSQQPIKVQEMYRQAQKNKLAERLNEIQETKDFLYRDLENAKNNGSDRLIYATEQMLNDELPTLNRWTDDITEQLKNVDNKDYFDNFGYRELLIDLLPENSRPALERLTDKEAKIVSERLNNAGIKGISYNGGIDGEANVIFNPDDIDIIPYYDNPTSLKEKFINLLNR